jgi:pantothenate kinase
MSAKDECERKRVDFDRQVHALACDLQARLHAHQQRDESRRYLVGIAGPPGSGKSLLAEELLRAVRELGTRAQLITQDGFHYTRAQLDRFERPATAHLRRGSPFTFDLPAFSAALRRVRDERTRCALPSFDHALKDPVPDDIEVLEEHDLVLVEGNYLALCDDQPQNLMAPSWVALPEVLDELWFLDGRHAFFEERVTRRHQEVWRWSVERARAQTDANDGINIRRVLSAVSARVTLRLWAADFHFAREQ